MILARNPLGDLLSSSEDLNLEIRGVPVNLIVQLTR
jgi:hypothetical protein